MHQINQSAPRKTGVSATKQLNLEHSDKSVSHLTTPYDSIEKKQAAAVPLTQWLTQL